MTRTFDRFDAGTSAADWHLDDVAALPVPYPGDRVVVLAAHPDDETLGAGGLIACLARRGVELTVVLATDGEASHPDSPTTTAATLAGLRRGEVQHALAALGVDTVRFLGLPDGGLAGHEATLTDQVAVITGGATHLISPWRGDRHPDHEACGRVAAAIASRIGARHWEYPVWAWHWAAPGGHDLPIALLRRLVLDPADRRAKSAALACHVSQHSPLSDRIGDEAILSPQLLEHFTGAAEHFIATGSHATSPESFDALYSRAPDPWNLADSFYEQRKRAVEFASLPQAHFRRAFEPGCALGLLTDMLAGRCSEVVAWDVTERSLAQARERTSEHTNVSFDCRQIPEDWPEGEFDLVMLSEVGYYCIDLDLLVRRVLDSLAPDGVVLACHWRRPAPDHPHTAAAVHTALRSTELYSVATHVEDDFLLDVWSRSPRSVAQRQGVVR